MTSAGPAPPPNAAFAWVAAALLVAGGAVMALAETRSPTITGLVSPLLNAVQLVLGLVLFGVALAAANRFRQLPWRRPVVAIALAFLGCVAAGQAGGVSWPNSGDEYSYVFFADTMLSGRLWTSAPPDPVLFSAYHVLVKDGRTFSPYPPGWPALLVPFRATGTLWLANPLLTVLTGLALAGGLGRLGLGAAVRRPALAMVLLAPFTLFLGGSLFPQTMACALVAGIVWAQLADEAAPRRWRKLLIGGLFGILFLTRHDVFALVAALYALDRLVIRRLGAVGDGLLVLAGVLPFVVLFAAGNAGVTGDPFRLPSGWAAASLFDSADPVPGSGPVMRAAARDLFWLGSLAQFGGLAAAVLAALALVVKIRRRTCRFFDLLLPAAVIFYSFVPFTGGHQVRAALLVLGLAALCPDDRNRSGRRGRLSPHRRAAFLVGGLRRFRPALCGCRVRRLAGDHARLYRGPASGLRCSRAAPARGGARARGQAQNLAVAGWRDPGQQPRLHAQRHRLCRARAVRPRRGAGCGRAGMPAGRARGVPLGGDGPPGRRGLSMSAVAGSGPGGSAPGRADACRRLAFAAAQAADLATGGRLAF